MNYREGGGEVRNRLPSLNPLPIAPMVCLYIVYSRGIGQFYSRCNNCGTDIDKRGAETVRGVIFLRDQTIKRVSAQKSVWLEIT